MGSLNKSSGSNIRRRIALVNITTKTPDEIEDIYNNNFGQVGWRIVQIISIGTSRYILAEKEE